MGLESTNDADVERTVVDQTSIPDVIRDD